MRTTRSTLAIIGWVMADLVMAPSLAPCQQTSPVLVGSSDFFASTVEVEDSFAYIGWGAGFDVLDVSDPHRPMFLTSVGGLEGNVTAIEVEATFAYVTTEVEGLQIIDISVPTAPLLLGSFSTPGSARDVVLSGTLAYVADGYYGLQIIDVSAPTAPVLHGSYDTPRFANAVVLAGSLAYVADGATLQLLDVADPAHPALRGSYPAAAASVVVSGSLVCLSDGTGLRILDASNPSAPSELGSLYPSLNSFDRIAVSGSIAYLATSLGLPETHPADGLLLVDISVPSEPTLVSSSHISSVQDMVFSGSRLYLAAGTQGFVLLQPPSLAPTETPSPTSTPAQPPTPSPSASPAPTPTFTPLCSDLNEDGKVDAEDLLLLMQSWHRSVTPIPTPGS